MLLGDDTGSIYAGKCKCGTKNKSVGKQRRISLLLQSEGQKVKNKVKQIGKFRYSFDKKGRMQTGWQILAAKSLFFQEERKNAGQ